MKTFKAKWNNKAVEDCGSYMSTEAKSFARAFCNMLKRELRNQAEIVKFNVNHYDFSCFIKDKQSGRYIYVSYSIPRYYEKISFSRTGSHYGVLYRFAADEKDYRGEQNHFSAIENLPNAIKASFERGF